ncbi:hypothetical protein [Treponema endosymbiont of Eucomonympha sp.]|uniref:hypothetical protein n=1 Tax=Treponema endosymbiont of Eucomonympha sp. TaxID=1580831 RepID=UPI000781BDCA|nr:hypothetical protein [Treponema endosymbiont of Eucomonympha sp.]
MKAFWLAAWQLPQMALALAVVRATRALRCGMYRGKRLYQFDASLHPLVSGVSLGEYIILPHGASEADKNHEYGHCVQSRCLGWLYLPLVGLPSALCNNVWDRVMHRAWSYKARTAWYYRRYPERWADRLGGVARSRRLTK